MPPPCCDGLRAPCGCAMRDLYVVLGVERTASQADLKKAYRKLAIQFHPDKNPDDKSAEEKFKEAANAYQILSDPKQRATYDRYGMEGLRGRGEGPGPNVGFTNVEDIFSAFGDLFGDFFGVRGGQSQQRGVDLRIDLELTFAEAVWGCSKDVKVTREAACTACQGTAAAKGTKPELCKTCEGRGQVMRSQGFFAVQTLCPRCHGAGKSIKEKCTACQGRGTKAASSTLTVSVPAGVDTDQTLRLAGKGESGPGGAGHLYVVLTVEPHVSFVRDGADVFTEEPVSFVKAVLGGKVEIRTLDEACNGVTTIDLPPGTQSNDVMVRSGQGIQRVGRDGRGEHKVRWQVRVPKRLTERQKELLRELAADLGED